MNNTKLDVIATNLAREWVEMMYNIRDTNWREFSGDKDANLFSIFWLVNPSQPRPSKITRDYDGKLQLVKFIDIHDTNCGSSLNEVYDDVWNFFDLIDNNELDELYHSIQTEGCNPEAFKDIAKSFTWARLDFTWTYSYFSWGQLATWEVNELFNMGDLEFYRVVRVYGVYKKNVDSFSEPCNGDCLKDNSPKEMRFCVKVFYRNPWWKHAKELCSIMTNFME